MKEIKSIKDLCEKIWALEKKFNLLNLEIEGVKIWQAQRMNYYYQIAQSSLIFELPHDPERNIIDNLKLFFVLLTSSIRYNPFFNMKKKDIIIFDHSRKVLVNGEFIDIYTKYLIDELELKGESVEIYETFYNNRHFSTKQKNRNHLDFIDLFSGLYSLIPSIGMKKQDKENLQIISEIVNDDIESPLFQKKIQRQVKFFKANYWFYSKLFSIKKPKKIFVVIGYGRAPVIKAAKDQNIEVIELQHGVISEYHLGYSYPNCNIGSIEYFPDRLLIWDNFWKYMCKFPISIDKIDLCKYTYGELQRQQFNEIARENKTLLVISQGVIGLRLSEIILKNITDLEEYSIFYKLHPSEYGRWQDYSSLQELKKYKNVIIIDKNSPPLYELFARSEYVIGVFSTALFESLDFNCKLILIDLPGIEYMKKVIELGKANLLKTNEKLIDCL